jgi:2-phospho-L-lactate guanylyltransferase
MLVGFTIDATALGRPAAGRGAVASGPTGVAGASLDRVIALVPVRSLEVAKSRLGGSLDAEERQAIVLQLLERTVRAASDACDAVIVISPDPEVLAEARRLGVIPMRQRTTGLNPALDEARTGAVARGATAVLVLPVDLAGVTGQAARDVIDAAGRALDPDRPVVVVVPDRHGQGTNTLLVSPARAIPFEFGEGSRHRHEGSARRADAVVVSLDSPLALDLDTPEDLLLAEPLLEHASDG